MTAADRMPHAERVTHDEHLASQNRPVGGGADRSHDPRRESQQSQASIRVGRHPVRRVAAALKVARHNRRLLPAYRRSRGRRRRIDANGEYFAPVVDNHARCAPARVWRGINGSVLKCHDRLARPTYRSSHPPLQLCDGCEQRRVAIGIGPATCRRQLLGRRPNEAAPWRVSSFVFKPAAPTAPRSDPRISVSMLRLSGRDAFSTLSAACMPADRSGDCDGDPLYKPTFSRKPRTTTTASTAASTIEHPSASKMAGRFRIR